MKYSFKYYFFIGFFFFNFTLFGQFSEAIEITNSISFPEFILSIDLDADGDLDIVSANGSGSTRKRIVWYENLGGGVFGLQAIISTSVEDVQQVIFFDMDGDSDLDLIYTKNTIENSVGWIENLGGGTFGYPNLLNSIHRVKRIHAADFDADGDIDLATTSYIDIEDKVAWYENLGGGIFGDQNILAADILISRDINSSDIDADGDIDLFVISDDRDLVWFENLGDGIFTDWVEIEDGFDALQSISIDDVDGDGDPDIAVTDFTDDKVSWIENLGGGDFSSEIIISTSVNEATDGYLADIDGDGDIDIVTSSFDHVVEWFENIGGGDFGDSHILSLTEKSSTNVIAADFDDDGDIDVLSSTNSGTIAWFQNHGGGVFAERVELNSCVNGAFSNDSNDLDSDGDIDVVSASGIDDKIAWYENLGEGVFASQVVLSDTLHGARNVKCGDLDGDGDIDIVASAREEQYSGHSLYAEDRIVWYENFGGGIFSGEILISNLINEPREIVLEDLDSDGDKDVASVSFDDDKVAWYENLGDGSFSPQSIISIELDRPHFIAASDLNNDGFNDILVTTSYDDKIVWFENLHDGTFSDEIIISDVLTAPFDIVAFDIDSDGDNDVISLDNGLKQICFHENLGGGVFADFVVVSTFDVLLNNLSVVDINGDGLADISFYENLFPRSSWIENLGDFTFSEKNPYTFQEHSPYYTSFGDIDGDSDLDVIAIAGLNSIDYFENYLNDPFDLTGQIFIDLNENGVKDTNELGTNLIQVTTSPENSYAYTGADGNFYLNFDGAATGDYEIYPEGLENWSVVTDSAVYNLTILEDSFLVSDTLLFGIAPDTLVNKLDVQLVGGFPRCNDEVNYWISIKNQGTTIPSGIIMLELDDSITFVSSYPEQDSIVEQRVYWSYEDLPYFSTHGINATVLMPNFMSMGEILTSTVTALVDSLSEDDFSESMEFNQVLRCAYDPNDKTANPEGIDSLGFISDTTELIEYTVRFQNTGNDTAITVKIKDQLDANLDWYSFEPLAASHDMKVYYDFTGMLTFTFDDIMLPDSSVNELGSQGFVKYRIRLNDDLPVGTQIKNTANIYFDYNPAVVTNTKINTLYNCSRIFEGFTTNDLFCFGDSLQLVFDTFPSNLNYHMRIDDFDSLVGNPLVWVADTVGSFSVFIEGSNDYCSNDTIITIEVLEEIPNTDLDTIFFCNGDSVLVFGSYYSDSGLHSKTLPSINGCDSTITQYLYLLPVLNVIEDSVFICEGDSILIHGNYQTEMGVYTDSLETIYGCDSILVMELKHYLNYSLPTDDVWICQGDSILIFDNYRKTEGLYYDSLVTIHGCDSILSRELIVFEPTEVNIIELEDETVCLVADIINLMAFPSGGVFSGSGVIGAEFSPLLAGEGSHTLFYTFEDENGCSVADSVQVTVVDCLSLPNENQSKITIFPNPFDNYTTIKFGEALQENHTIIISNILGQVVYRNENVLGSQLEIKKEQLGVGIFFLTLYNSDLEQIYTAKLVVK